MGELGTEGAPSSGPRSPRHHRGVGHIWWTTNDHQGFLGSFLAVFLGFLLTCTSQLAQNTYKEGQVTAPFFVVYFTISTIMILFPLQICSCLLIHKEKFLLKKSFKEWCQVFCSKSPGFPPVYKVLGKCTIFCLLFNVTSYMYIRSLNMKPALDCVAVFATASSFAYLLSWVVLHDRFIGVRIVSMILSITGIIFVTYHTKFGSPSMWGAILAAGSATGVATFQVFFKKVVGDASLGQFSCFMACLGLFNFLTMWPVFLMLYFLKAEPLNWQDIPWDCVSGTSVLTFLIVILVVFGQTKVRLSWVHFGFILAIPSCAGVDVVWRKHKFDGMQIAAYVLIIVAYFLNLLPYNWHETVLKIAHIKRREEYPSQEIYSPRARLKVMNK